MTKNQILELNKAFGAHVKAIREQQGLSLVQLSYKCSLDESHISKIENGKKNINLSTLFELAKGLGTDPIELIQFN